MLFKEVITLRILELCKEYKYTPNKLAELSDTIIFKICKTLKISLKISIIQLYLI